MQKAAEHVYAQTQPYRYAVYLRGAPGREPRTEEARTAFQRLTAAGAREEQAWAWQGLATMPGPNGSGDKYAALMLRKAIAVFPDYTLAHVSLAGAEANMGHAETALGESRIAANLLARSSIPDIDPDYLATARAAWTMRNGSTLGDFAQTVRLGLSGLELPDQAAQHELMRIFILAALGQQHDGAAAREFFRGLPAASTPTGIARRAVSEMRLPFTAENWKAVLAQAASTIALVEEGAKRFTAGTPFDRRDMLMTQIYPWMALAKAKLGDFAGAEAAIAATPGDCYDCLRIRGMIAAEARQWPRADFWFAKAVHDGPSLPFAHTRLGRVAPRPRQARRRHREVRDCQQKGPALRRSAGRLGRSADGEEPVRPGAGEIRGSREIRAQLGPAASEMGRGARLCRQADEAQRTNSPAPPRSISRHPKNPNWHGWPLMSEDLQAPSSEGIDPFAAVPGPGRRQPRRGRCLPA